MRKNLPNHGFTLVELAIVIVIIGLLIGGVLIAQGMVTSSRVSAQVKQLQQYDIAVSNLKQQLGQIPGDCNMCAGGEIGNNNGRLNDLADVIPPLQLWREPAIFFVHLSAMKHISENYVYVAASYLTGEGKQFPEAKIGTGGIVVSGNYRGDIYYVFSPMSTANLFSGRMTTGTLSPQLALALDSKMDDGLPLAGNVVAIGGAASVSTAKYPFVLQTSGASLCVNGTFYNVALETPNLCRIIVKSAFDPSAETESKF